VEIADALCPHRSGVVDSYGENYINGNGSNTGSLTPISKQ